MWSCEVRPWKGTPPIPGRLRRLELLPLLKADYIFLMTSSPNGSELPASVLVKSQKKSSLEKTERRDRIFSSELSEGEPLLRPWDKNTFSTALITTAKAQRRET